MKTKLLLAIAAFAALTLASCVAPPPGYNRAGHMVRNAYYGEYQNGGQMQYAQPATQQFAAQSAVSGSTISSQKFKYRSANDHKDYPVPTSLNGIIANGRFCRDADGCITEQVRQAVIAGGLIRWDGKRRAFALPDSQEEALKFSDTISTDQVVRACLKAKRMPGPTPADALAHGVPNLQALCRRELEGYGVVF